MVSLLDFTKTWLNLAGAEMPAVMQGNVFLGDRVEPEPQYVYSFRERMDERYDSSRSVRDKRFVYIKNYMPFILWGEHHDYLLRAVSQNFKHIADSRILRRQVLSGLPFRLSGDSFCTIGVQGQN